MFNNKVIIKLYDELKNMTNYKVNTLELKINKLEQNNEGLNLKIEKLKLENATLQSELEKQVKDLNEKLLTMEVELRNVHLGDHSLKSLVNKELDVY